MRKDSPEGRRRSTLKRFRRASCVEARALSRYCITNIIEKKYNFIFKLDVPLTAFASTCEIYTRRLFFFALATIKRMVNTHDVKYAFADCKMNLTSGVSCSLFAACVLFVVSEKNYLKFVQSRLSSKCCNDSNRVDVM